MSAYPKLHFLIDNCTKSENNSVDFSFFSNSIVQSTTKIFVSSLFDALKMMAAAFDHSVVNAYFLVDRRDIDFT